MHTTFPELFRTLANVAFSRCVILSKKQYLQSSFFLSAEVSSEYSMEKAMVEFAIMDRELNNYIKAVESAMNHVSLYHSPGYIWLQFIVLEIETEKSQFFFSL